MREWWTAADLAERALPGLPSSKRGVNKLAQREGWPQRRAAEGHLLVRTAQAGGVEYHVALLPEAARIAVAAEALCSRASSTTKAASPTESAAAPAPAGGALVRDARMAIMVVQRQHAETASLTLRKSDEGFALAYNDGRIAVDDWVRAAIPEVSARTLRRWRGHAGQDAGRLAGRQGRGAVSVLDVANEGAVAELIGGALARQPHLTAAHVRALVRAAFGDQFEITDDAGEIVRVALPLERAFRRFIANWKAVNEMALTKLTDPDRFKSHFRVSGLSRYRDLDRLNQVWETDASPADVLCVDGRYQVYALVDVWSRRMLIFVTRT
ncbi:MAG: DNA-binding protein, partial [Hyphomicrobium sp.]